jgi:hypothetical protein
MDTVIQTITQNKLYVNPLINDAVNTIKTMQSKTIEEKYELLSVLFTGMQLRDHFDDSTFTKYVTDFRKDVILHRFIHAMLSIYNIVNYEGVKTFDGLKTIICREDASHAEYLEQCRDHQEEFLEELRIYKNDVRKLFVESQLFKTICKVIDDKWIKQHTTLKCSPSMAKNRNVYSHDYTNSYILSVDVKQGNFTSLFHFVGQKLGFKTIEDYGFIGNPKKELDQKELDKIEWSDILQLTSNNSVFNNSRMLRQIALGKIGKMHTDSGTLINTIMESCMQYMINSVIITCEKILSQYKVINVSKDEVTYSLQSFNDSNIETQSHELTQLINASLLASEFFDMYNHVHIRIYKLNEYELHHRAKFYVRHFTDGSHDFKCIKPEDYLEALAIHQKYKSQ